MDRIILVVLSLLTLVSVTLPLSIAYGDQNRTGFTDGQKTPPGTNVIAGEEAPRSGPQGGVKTFIKKHKKSKHKKKRTGVIPRGSAQGEEQGSSQQLHSYPKRP